jgi:hypothetical protein
MRQHLVTAARRAHPYRHVIAVFALLLALGSGVVVYEARSTPARADCGGPNC